MKISLPREIKVHECRVGLTPESVRDLVSRGHSLMVEAGAGVGISASDEDYRVAGACISSGPDEIFKWAELTAG